ncbi:extracellular solute-binding protein [Arthrobacter sp. GMC3]|uniref:extracellular solute-binding protein n=1 Tax=Arthrobacter sp. GMC3 TaxID=2058894 RepID=UPI000CE5169E|nr:extracellular solute-binding protein [Arthrobacter sp. GMC3]
MKTSFSRRSFLGSTISAAVLAGVGATTLSSCSSGGKSAAVSAQGAGILPSYTAFKGVVADSPGAAGRATDVFFRYPANPVKVISAIPGDGNPFTALTLADATPPALESNRYWQQVNERLGSPYRPSFAPGADYAAKFATVSAGGEMPDFFTVLPDTPSQPELFKATALDLSEHLAGDAINDYPFLANIPTESWRGTVFNGRIYALPISRGTQNTWVMYGRKDLLAAKGITKDPASYEEFYAQLKELTEPSQNKWALASIPLDYVRQMHGIGNKWTEKDGVLTSAVSDEAQQDALEATRKIVEAGFINPDAATTPNDRQKNWIQAGSSAFGWFTLSAWSTLKTEGSGAYDAQGVTVPGFSSGQTGTAWLGDPNHSIVGIAKANKDRVKTILSMANWMATPFGTEEYLFRNYGVEGVHYNMVDGSPKAIAATGPERALGLGYLSAPPRTNFSPLKDVLLANQKFEFAVTETAVSNAATGLFSNAQSRRGAALDTALKNLELDIVLGRKPVADWAAGVKTYKSSGGDQIATEYKDALAANK